MWELINQKHDAQRAVFDKVPQNKTVEEIMAEATSAQLAVAKALVSLKRAPIATADVIPTLPNSHTPQPATSKQLPLLNLFERHGAQGKRPAKPIVVPEQQLSLFDLATA